MSNSTSDCRARRKHLPLSVPVISGSEWQYVKQCLDTGWVSSVGSFVDRFEREFSERVGASYAVACVSGTAALHCALRVVGVCVNDEVLVPTLTFIATVNAVHYVGAHPLFMDCDEYYNMDVLKVDEFLRLHTDFRDGFTWNRVTGRRISAIVPVHVFGHAVDLERLLPLCKDRNIRVVEDATESLGTFYLEGALRNCHTGAIGDLGCYSFNGNKIITCGGGGMIVTQNEQYARQARYLTTQAKDDAVRFVHNAVGYNFRLTNLQAAVGVAQLERLNDFISVKKRNYALYREEISHITGLRLAEPPPYADCNMWFYCLQVDTSLYGSDRETLMSRLESQGIQSRPVWHLNHLQLPYAHCQSYRIECAPRLHACTLNLPCSCDLTQEDVGTVVECLKR